MIMQRTRYTPFRRYRLVQSIIPTANQPLPSLTLLKGLATDVDIILVGSCVEVAIVWLCCAVRVWNSGPASDRSTGATRLINLGHPLHFSIISGGDMATQPSLMLVNAGTAKSTCTNTRLYFDGVEEAILAEPQPHAHARHPAWPL